MSKVQPFAGGCRRGGRLVCCRSRRKLAGMTPTLGNGKICYVELPAQDVQRSAEFYQTVFGWQVRRRGDGALAFDDGVGEVSGTWVTGRPPAGMPGLLGYVMVD